MHLKPICLILCNILFYFLLLFSLVLLDFLKSPRKGDAARSTEIERNLVIIWQ